MRGHSAGDVVRKSARSYKIVDQLRMFR